MDLCVCNVIVVPGFCLGLVVPFSSLEKLLRIGRLNSYTLHAPQSGGGMSLAMEEKILNIENNVIDIKEVCTHITPECFHC